MHVRSDRDGRRRVPREKLQCGEWTDAAAEGVCRKHPRIRAHEVEGSSLGHQPIAETKLHSIGKGNRAERPGSGGASEFAEGAY